MPNQHQSPLKLLLLITITIFVVEGFIMIFIAWSPWEISPMVEGTIDAVFLVLITSPVLYLFMFRPLMQQLEHSHTLEKELLKHQDELEEIVAERTKRLQKLNQVVEQSTISVIITDLEGTIEYVNPKFIELTGYSFDEAVGKNPRILKSGKQSLDFYKNLWDTITSGNNWKGDFENKKKNGEIYWESASIVPLKNGEGRITHFVAVMEDITVQKQFIKALQDSEEKYRSLSDSLDKTNNMKKLLLDVITHDLKTPVGVVREMAAMLVDENPDDGALRLIKDSSNSLLNVIENASILSRVALNEEIEKEELDLFELIRKAIQEFTPALKEAGMNLEFLPKDALMVKANPIIREVFKNYISNGIKYSPEGKKMIIESRLEKDSVTISVKDFGKRINRENYENIFERGIQLNNGKNRGRGLGLAIVKRIAEAHRGEVWVEPNEPNGNIFYIKLPLL